MLVFASTFLHARPHCERHLLPHRSLQTRTPRKHRGTAPRSPDAKLTRPHSVHCVGVTVYLLEEK